jgi:hypothetical protein
MESFNTSFIAFYYDIFGKFEDLTFHDSNELGALTNENFPM